MLVVSYNGALIVANSHRILKRNVTIRGIVFVHPNTDDFPILFSATEANVDFDLPRQELTVGVPIEEFTILNCEFLGDGTNGAGAVIGRFGNKLEFRYNLVQNFFTRAVDIEARSVTVQLNTFEFNTGRSFRGRVLDAYVFEENLMQECTGLNAADEVDIVSLEARVKLEEIEPPSISDILAAIFGDFDLDSLFEPSISNPNMGCNPSFNSKFECFIRGNRQTTTPDQPDQSVVVYNVFGGNMTFDRVRDNTADKGQIGMRFIFTVSIGPSEAPDIFKQNALIRVVTPRKIDDDAADFAFQRPGSLISLSCAFPNCLAEGEVFPFMEVSKRCNLNIVEQYGFACINNLTASWVSLPLNLLNMTSGRARLRREDILFTENTWVVGFEGDLPCCDKPVIYGAKHTFTELSPVVIMEHMEFRYEFDPAIEDDGTHLFLTELEFNMQELRLFNVCLDGRYTLSGDQIKITEIFMDEQEGVFFMAESLVYNWWHFPPGTVTDSLGGEDGDPLVRPDDLVPVVRLPDNGTVFNTEQSPDIDGIFVTFLRRRRVSLSPFAINPETGFIFIPNSEFIFRNNFIRDLDGRAFTCTGASNYDVKGNILFDCGMRQFEEIAVIDLEGHFQSVGDYFCENNIINQTKPFLFPFGGGAANAVRKAGFWVHTFGIPDQWTFRNNTVVLHDGNSSGIILEAEEEERGQTVGARFSDMERSILCKTLSVGNPINLTLLFFFEPRLACLRVLASEMNSIDSQSLIVNGFVSNLSQIPKNGPGVQGINDDIIFCTTFSDVLENEFNLCDVCNDGCPVPLPTTCVVDAENDTFIPGNPYFGSWLFVSIDDALLNCKNPEGLIEVVNLTTGVFYEEQIDFQTPGRTLFSNTNAEILVRQSVLVNAHNITMRGLVLFHDPGLPGPTIKEGTALGFPPDQFALDDMDMRGQNTIHEALKGEFVRLAITLSLFRGYQGARVIDVESDCGVIFIEGNTFENPPGSAIFASDYIFLVVNDNHFENCGGRIDGELACVFLQMCRDITVEMLFTNNRHFQDPDDVLFPQTGPDNGYVAAYWLDGLPLNAVNVTLDFHDNRAMGLPIALRITNIDDEGASDAAKRQVMNTFVILWQNVFLSGTWHDIVRCPPSDDHLIDLDSTGNMHKFCDDGCASPIQNIALVITLIVLTALIFLYLCSLFSSYSYNSGHLRYSVAMDMYVPNDPRDWDRYFRRIVAENVEKRKEKEERETKKRRQNVDLLASELGLRKSKPPTRRKGMKLFRS